MAVFLYNFSVLVISGLLELLLEVQEASVPVVLIIKWFHTYTVISTLFPSGSNIQLS